MKMPELGTILGFAAAVAALACFGACLLAAWRRRRSGAALRGCCRREGGPGGVTGR